jgi:hypothetical protein
MAKDMKGLLPGQSALGFIGKGPAVAEEEERPEYTPEEINERQGIRNLLKKYITPPALGSKFTERQSLIRFNRKVDTQSLADLRRFWDGPIPENGNITIEEQAELQRRWDELSP